MEDDSLLLYGFCSATSQETYAWKQEKVSKTKQSIWKAILTEDECNYFLDKLTQSGVITLGETSFTSPQLFKRAIVLSNDGVNEKEGPIDKYRQLTEFWNTNKMDLLHEVMKSMGTDGRELYEDIKKLLDWMLQECGIKFFKNAHRFGNFEFYHSTIHENNFIVESHKEYALLKTTVTKRCEYNRRLIVNCVSEHRERTICNQTKIFLPEEQCLEFVAEEPMSKVVIQIWDEESGKLLFSYNGTLLMRVCIGMNMGSSSYRVRDPWSHMLQNELCSCNYERDMENHILLYVKGIEARYGQDSEKEILKREIDWSAFESAAEPELKNYAYEKWHKAYIRAKRQLQFLQIYVEMHPNSVKAKKYIEIWEKRIE